jgi:tetratricopeptide (TPR) repeat protein
MKIRLLAITVAALIILIGAAFFFLPRTAPAVSLEDARAMLRTGQPEQALVAAKAVLEANPTSIEALRIAAQASIELQQPLEAAGYFRQLPGGDRIAVDTLAAAAALAIESGTILKAEQLLRLALEIQPHDVPIHRRMASILNATGRRAEAAVHGKFCILAGALTVEELLLWSNPDEPYQDEKILPRAQQAAPDDPGVRLGSLMTSISAAESSQDVDELRSLRQHFPESPEIEAAIGNYYLDHGEFLKFLSWHQSLSAASDDHAEVWFVRGRWAQMTEQSESAVRCFFEAATRAPLSRRAVFLLGQQLAVLGRQAESRICLQRAERLSQLQITMRPVYFEGADLEKLRTISAAFAELGGATESLGWAYAATRLFPNDRAAADEYRRLLSGSRASNAHGTEMFPGKLDLSIYPLPVFEQRLLPQKSAVELQSSVIRFSDDAARVGIQFQYFSSDDPTTRGKRIFETTGGGVAAADFDLNGWPDLYWTQGCRWPVNHEQREFRDLCYMNTGRDSFVEISKPAGLEEYGYSQGVAAGDLNHDGFPDLYVANIGQNQLFLNNGDGTFTGQSSAGFTDNSWTTSCAIVDLNGDSHPDLFDGNYLSDRSTYERGCGTDDPDECSPAAFSPAQSRMFLSAGDGGWIDGTSSLGLSGIEGKTLGVVAVRTPGSVIPDLFLANDGEANSYLRGFADTVGQVSYRETAVFCGVAFDRDGRAQASMGVAADDYDGDGLVDFFVTNFYRESNTLYHQQIGVLFTDESRTANLREHSLLKLGFGTQFLDANLDGKPDLVLTNGHVVDRSHKGEGYHMPPQFFLNTGNGLFQELKPEGTTPYFAGQYLGRGLARIDWNRDGKEDFAVSHLDSRASLVTNESESTRGAISLHLTGTLSARDPIGANVTVIVDGRQMTRQLLAGDGYEASNQRLLVFGMGTAEFADQIQVEWPSGLKQTFAGVSSGSELRLIEGRAEPYAVSAR